MTSGQLNRTAISTAGGSFSLELAVETYAPVDSCAQVFDSRTASTGTISLSPGGPTAVGAWNETLAALSPEGSYELDLVVRDCASGVRIDTSAPFSQLETLAAGTGGVIKHTPASLDPVLHDVTVTVEDLAGNASEPLTWQFLVTSFTGASSAARPDPERTGSVPLVFAPGTTSRRRTSWVVRLL